MPTPSRPFRLKVQQVEHACLFELSWGDGLQLTAQLPFPERLWQRYGQWQQAYLSYYKTTPLSVSKLYPTESSRTSSELRGRVASAGQAISTTRDRHSQLTQSETLLLYEFQTWLRSAELYDIRAAIAQGLQQQAAQPEGKQPMTLFLTCTPLDLARLPWEVWELGTDFATLGTLHIVRAPANIREAAGRTSIRRQRPRILAVLGDDAGLNFQVDREAVRSLTRLADIEFVGWQPGQSAAQVKTQICDAITDERGWDVLFFAGHSNETQLSGGELAIAPRASVTIRDLAPHLAIARERGLKFALFNSCSGLNIAESLIDLGFSQVAVMREPVHNRVAQEFLVAFFRALAEHQTVQEAMVTASQSLKSQKSFTFPSAYLLPSLFCHPGATPFRIPPAGWRQVVQRAIPRRYEAIALLGCMVLTGITPVQTNLLEQRLYAQSVYRQVTGQIPPASPPPVTLVQIDDKSVRLSGMADPNPIERRYLAQVLDALVARDARVIGIDYLLDRQQPDTDPVLAASVQRAVEQNTWLVFGALYQPDGEVGLGETTGIADLNWVMQGYIESFPWAIALLEPNEDCRQTCPFPHLLALAHWAETELEAGDRPTPALKSTSDLRTQLVDRMERASRQNPELGSIATWRYAPLTLWAHNTLKQFWLMPIVDYSLPPEQVYRRLPAWMLLEEETLLDDETLDQLAHSVVLIGSGYAEAGINEHSDYFDLPPALAYWRDRPSPTVAELNRQSPPPDWLTGAEAHAYSIHHRLQGRRVISIPVLWLVGLSGLLGFVLTRSLRSPLGKIPAKRRRHLLLGGGAIATLLYGLLALQAFVSAQVLLPWLLPSLVFWVYLLPSLRKTTHD